MKCSHVFPKASLAIAMAVLLLLAPAETVRARPEAAASLADSGGVRLAVGYSLEELRPRATLEKESRSVLDGTLRVWLPQGAGLWARARSGGPWKGGDTSWALTDLDFGPWWQRSRIWDRVDVTGWVTFSAAAGKTPSEGVWHRGLRDWSYGFGSRISARVLGGGASLPIWLGFDVRYRTQGRSGWVYLPRHSVAIADTAGAFGGPVLTWQGRLELRGSRAVLATVVLREEPLDAAGALAQKERPFFLIQSAAVKIRGRLGAVVTGEVLLSGDDKETEFSARSVLPSWAVSFGASWGLPY